MIKTINAKMHQEMAVKAKNQRNTGRNFAMSN